MTVIERINIKPIDLRLQKVKECTEYFIELRDNSLLYSIRFHADEPKDEEDEALGWEEKFTCVTNAVNKQYISGIEKRCTEYRYWGVYIITVGYANDLKLYFKRESEAQEIFDKLHKWLYE